MAALTEAQAQELLDDIVHLASKAGAAGDDVREGMLGLRPSVDALLQACGVASDGKLAQGSWTNLNGRDGLVARLQSMQKALQTLVPDRDEPRDPGNFMYRTHASNELIWLLVGGALVIVAVVLWGIFRYWNGATAKDATERDMLRMVILMGALGGTVHWMSSLANFVGNGNLFRRWSPYYLLSPFQGAALALLVYLLLRVGVLSPNSAGTAAQNLNLLGVYAFSALAGLFAKQAIEMLRDVFGVLFKKVEAKDASKDRKPGASDAEPAKPPAPARTP
jgi:hypothetical protein